MATEATRRSAEAMLGAVELPSGEAGWARDIRASARTRFLEAGAPMRRDEYWRYTDPARLTVPLAPVAAGEPGPAPREDFGGVPARVARFANGRFRADLSDDLSQPDLAVAPLGEVLRQDLTFARDIFGQLERAGQEKVLRPLAMLNTAAATEGLAIKVTGPVAEPLHIAHEQVGEGASLTRHLVRVETGGSLTLLESGVPSSGVIEIDLAPGARLSHIRVQTGERAPAATHIFARVGEGASFKTFTLTADGSLTRNEVVMDLTGDDATGHIAGAVLGRGEAHIDNTVFVTHSALRGESRQVFKNVLTDRSRAVFQGKIFVRKGAQKTDGYQISQSVVLDEGAEFLVKPELEIYADDVKCSHGSTTGALDEAALFYLRARGVPERVAEAMLVAAFVDEAIMEIEDERLAEAMRAAVERWMSIRF